jgi:superfamily II DNA or RNA helicase
MAGTLLEIEWRVSYGPRDERLSEFYIPALSRSVHYERSAGYFSSSGLAVAAAGVARLIQNGGTMRLLVGAELSEDDVEAIRDGEELDKVLRDKFLDSPELFEEALRGPKKQRLEALAWMVAEGTLDIRVVVPKGPDGLPVVSDESYFHVKNGVFRDAEGNEVAFQGSVNESWRGWMKHYEDLAIYTSWETEQGDTRAHLRRVKERIDRLWAGTEEDWIAVTLPQAVKDRLVAVHKPNEPPSRDPWEKPLPDGPLSGIMPNQDERIVMQFIRAAPRLSSARQLAAGTSQVQPWPHQVKVADKVTASFPEGFVLCDEVGLGKTIEAGLVLRQLVLDGRVERAMVLVPSAIVKQFQEELWEKFSLDIPRYDGSHFVWRNQRKERSQTDNPWNAHDLFLATSHLAKRKERRQEILAARPWDLLLVDEAHHARRRDFQDLDRYRRNNLLALLTQLREHQKVRCLLLMTATPMQIHPVEVFDLLHLVGMGGKWGAHPSYFLDFFSELRKDSPLEMDWDLLLGMTQEAAGEPHAAFARVAEERLGLVRWEQVKSVIRATEPGRAVRQLDKGQRAVLVDLVRHATPLRDRIQRNTRNLLRKYREKGILKEEICDRDPEPVWVTFTPEEEALYEEVDVYISDFYKRYETQRKGLGFVMTVYRRRLTSSFYALRCSLQRRLGFLKTGEGQQGLDDDDLEEVSLYDDWDEEFGDGADFVAQEVEFIEDFLRRLEFLPADSKIAQLHEDLQNILERRDSVLVFTQYTDTMDHLREQLVGKYGTAVACYSGRGGEIWDGTVWKKVSKEATKGMFRSGDLKVLLGTEAMSEGLNLQTCGVLINFDMPWNPMRVEQRIGRIDRIGQKHAVVWVRNYFYEKSVEAVVYRRLQDRIQWFETVVGALQPILHRVEKTVRELAMMSPEERKVALESEVRSIQDEIDRQEAEGLDLDQFLLDEVARPIDVKSPVTLAQLEKTLTGSPSLSRHFETHPDVEGAWLLRLEHGPIAVTFLQDVFDRHPETLRLMTFGEPLLEALLDRVPPPDASDHTGRLLAVTTAGGKHVAFCRPTASFPQPVETLTDLQEALGSAATRISDSQAAAAREELGNRVARLRQRELDLQDQMASSKLASLEHEGRLVIRKAASVHFTLSQSQSTTLFTEFESRQGNLTWVPPDAARAFAQEKGVPYSSLLALVGQETVTLETDDPYLAKTSKKQDRTLRGMAANLERQARGLLDSILDMKRRSETPHRRKAAPEVTVTCLE